MLVSPILICRTKYVDYQNPVFCAPPDMDDAVLHHLHDDIIKGNNIKVIDNHENKVFISTHQWILIGKIMEICQLGKSLDTSLDKEEGGRSAWGFIGGVISRKDYIAEDGYVDLPDTYYSHVYKKCLYDEHWLESEFNGPYRYDSIDIQMELIKGIDAYDVTHDENIPIFSDKMNDNIFVLAIKDTRDGKCVAFCSNEEFNAAINVSSGILTYTTVSDQRIKGQIEYYKQLKNKKRQVKNVHVKRDFYSELVKLCEDFGYKPVLTENKKFKGYFIPIEQKVCIDEDKNNIFIKKFKDLFDNDK